MYVADTKITHNISCVTNLKHLLFGHCPNALMSLSLTLTQFPSQVPSRCGQPGSDKCPHTSNSTQDHWIYHQSASSILIITPTSTFSSKLPILTFASSVTMANNSSALNTVRGLLKPHSFDLRTLCQISQQTYLAKTQKFHTFDVCCVSVTRKQNPSVVIHLTLPHQNAEPMR